MIFHIATFTWKDTATQRDIEELEAALRADVMAFPDVTVYACGSDLGIRSGSEGFAIVAGAETAEALKGYLDDDGHKAIAVQWRDFIATKHSVEFESEISPGNAVRA
jgi:hypothetical protein